MNVRVSRLPGLVARFGAGYLVAVSLVVLAAALRGALVPVMGTRYVFGLFVPVVALSTWAGGLGPGLAATLGSVCAGALVLLAASTPVTGADVLGFTLFAAASGLIVVLVDGQRTGQRKAIHYLKRSRAAERARRESEERLQLAQEAAHAGTYDWNLVSGRIVRSAEYHRMLGTTAAAEANFEGYLQRVHPDDRARVRDAVERCVAGEGDLHVEYRIETPHGLRTVVNRGRTYSDASGRPQRMTGLAVDVTEARAAARSLRQVEARFRGILEKSPVAIFAKDLDGRHIIYNRACEEWWGLPAEQVLGRTDEEFASPEEARRHREADAAAIERGDAIAFEEERRSGRDVLLVKFPLRDDAGEISGVCGFAMDISRQKALERDLLRQTERLEEESRRKDEFLAMLGHELRNPLAPVANAAEVLRRVAPGSRESEWARDVIARQTRHLARLVDDLLDVSRITRGLIELRRGRVELGELLRRVVDAQRPVLEARGQTLVADLGEAPVSVVGDPDRLAQVVNNLLENASKYSSPGGRVELVLRQEADRAVLVVRDHGAGIPREMLERIFELFVQVSPPLDRARGGLGLGLTLVRRLCAMHGGEITAHSDGPGTGATFTVRLPALAADGARPFLRLLPTPPAPPHAAAPVSGPSSAPVSPPSAAPLSPAAASTPARGLAPLSPPSAAPVSTVAASASPSTAPAPAQGIAPATSDDPPLEEPAVGAGGRG